MRWPGGWKGQRGDVGEAGLSVGQEGRVVRHDCPNGTGRDGTQRNKRAQQGQQWEGKWWARSKVMPEPDRELDPGHRHGEEKDYEASGGERDGEDQEGRKKVTQSLWTWIRGRIAETFVM